MLLRGDKVRRGNPRRLEAGRVPALDAYFAFTYAKAKIAGPSAEGPKDIEIGPLRVRRSIRRKAAPPGCPFRVIRVEAFLPAILSRIKFERPRIEIGHLLYRSYVWLNSRFCLPSPTRL